MLQDQFRESSRIENEYKKLLTAWELELSTNPSTDIKKTKINKSEHIQFNLMQLFNGYLDQIWKDSQTMLQCAQAWSSESAGIYARDAIFTVNILGLHFMKQSLQTRQELFSIVDQFNPTSFGNGKFHQVIKSVSCVLLDSNIISEQEYNIDQQKHIINDLDQRENSESNITIKCSERELDNYFEFPATNESSANSSVSIALDRPIKLTSSPSTPTISQDWSFAETDQCTNSFSPACNYGRYYPTIAKDENNGTAQHKLSCHFCQETIPLKKSFSVDNIYSLQQNLLNTVTDDEEGSTSEIEEEERRGYYSSSGFDITSLYYYIDSEEDEEDIMERELLLAKDDGGVETIRHKYLLTGDGNTEDSLKIEICDDQFSGSSTSSSIIIQYDSTLKKLRKCGRFNYGRIELSPTSSSFESSKSSENVSDNNKSTINTYPTSYLGQAETKVMKEEGYGACGDQKKIQSMTADKTGLSRIFRKKTSKSAQQKNSNNKREKKHTMKHHTSNSIMRSLSNVKLNSSIRNIFSSANQSTPIPSR